MAHHPTPKAHIPILLLVLSVSVTLAGTCCNTEIILIDERFLDDMPENDGVSTDGASTDGNSTDPNDAIWVSPFNASYSSETADRPSPVVLEQTVEKISLNYSYDDFAGIDSEDFLGVWDGTIDVFGHATVVYADFNVSWSDVSVRVDKELVDAWSDDSKTIPLFLEPGAHAIRIVYRNNWHTTNVNVSFSRKEALSVFEAQGAVFEAITEASRIHAVAVYESGHIYNDIIVHIPESAHSIALFLASFESVNWIINNPYDTVIDCIVYGAYRPASTLSTAEDVSTYKLSDINQDSIIDDISTIIGEYPDKHYYDDSPSEVILGAT